MTFFFRCIRRLSGDHVDLAGRGAPGKKGVWHGRAPQYTPERHADLPTWKEIGFVKDKLCRALSPAALPPARYEAQRSPFHFRIAVSPAITAFTAAKTSVRAETHDFRQIA